MEKDSRLSAGGVTSTPSRQVSGILPSSLQFEVKTWRKLSTGAGDVVRLVVPCEESAYGRFGADGEVNLG